MGGISGIISGIRGECVGHQACEDVIVNRLELRCYTQLCRMKEAVLLPRFQTAWLVVIRGERETSEHQPELGGASWPPRRRRLSERLCFPLEHCLRRLRTAVTAYFPAEENLVFDLVSMSIWWLFLKRRSTEKDHRSSRGSKPAKNQLGQHVAADCTSTRLTGFTGAAVENTTRPQPSGIHNRIYFGGKFTFHAQFFKFIFSHFQ